LAFSRRIHDKLRILLVLVLAFTCELGVVAGAAQKDQGQQKAWNQWLTHFKNLAGSIVIGFCAKTSFGRVVLLAQNLGKSSNFDYLKRAETWAAQRFAPYAGPGPRRQSTA
jgi:hypothetical protein